MRTLFYNIKIINENSLGEAEKKYVVIKDEYIEYIGTDYPEGNFDVKIDGKGNLMLPGFYNAHCHSAMTLFRGLGDDLPLKAWLDDVMLPAEEKLTPNAVYAASMLAIAEMLKCGTISFTDMYYFTEDTAKAVIESGIKANLSRCIVSFDPDADPSCDQRVKEAVSLYDSYNNCENGRIIVDFSIHGEYTNTKKMCRYISGLAQKRKAIIDVHLSETENEHIASIERNGKTPTKFFLETGVLDSPVNCAHAVWVSDEDIDILASHKAGVVHNPRSNLKLGSGIMPIRKLMDAGVNITLGTDGAASNNSLDVFDEMRVASILHKGYNKKADITKANEFIPMLTKNGANSQGRADCGVLKAGNKADIVIMNLNSPHFVPIDNYYSAIAYSAKSSDIQMTMVDGKILYQNGEFTTIDMEKTIFEVNSFRNKFFSNRYCLFTKKIVNT